ncbi:hypothetical protein SUGI_0650140 [Cryptomeria japonica]|nr:hypothetical protein SUGI_0650140 [Cryptomeria japonica]
MQPLLAAKLISIQPTATAIAFEGELQTLRSWRKTLLHSSIGFGDENPHPGIGHPHAEVALELNFDLVRHTLEKF